jgi:hypothetical protein
VVILQYELPGQTSQGTDVLLGIDDHPTELARIYGIGTAINQKNKLKTREINIDGLSLGIQHNVDVLCFFQWLHTP